MVGTWWPRNVPLYWWVFGGSLITRGVLRAFAPSCEERERTIAEPNSAAHDAAESHHGPRNRAIVGFGIELLDDQH